MTSTGQVYPSAAETVAESPWSDTNCLWVNPGNIYADDGVSAEVTHSSFDTPDQTYVLKAYTFDFSSIPDGSTILGVTCRINIWYAVAGVSLDLLQLLNTARVKVGTNQCATPVALTTNNTTIITKGGAADLWGNALTAAWVKDADFGVAIGCLATGANSDVFCDYVTLEIEYTAPAFVTGAGTIAAVSSVAGAGQVTKTGSGSVAAVSAVNGAGTLVLTGTGQITALSALAGSGQLTLTGAGLIAGVSTITGAGTVGGLITGAGTIAAQSGLAGSGQVILLGQGSIAAQSEITGAGCLILMGAGAISGISALTSSGQIALEGAGTVEAVSSMAGAGTVETSGIVTGAGAISAQSGLAGAGQVLLVGSGQIAGQSGVSGAGTVISSLAACLYIDLSESLPIIISLIETEVPYITLTETALITIALSASELEI